jgi:AraC family chitin signaling transcriptional activator
LKRSIIFIFSVFGFFALIGQELPPIQTYTPELYKAGSQNWNISQNDSGVIYVANNEGLLSFDGAHWRLYPSPNASILRSVYVHNNVIYSGAYMDFGYWKSQPDGSLHYVSLVDKLGFKMLEDEQVWNINHYKQFVVFQSLNRLLIYNQVTNSLSTLNPPTDTILKSYFVDEDVYIQTNDFSIYKINSDELIKVASGASLKQKLVIKIFDKGEDLLFLTEKDGFFALRPNQIIPWRISAQKLLEKSLVYSATQINDDYYAIGTVTDGLILLDIYGNIVFSAKKGSGLNNNTVLSTFVDANQNLWVGLDNGLAFINLNSDNQFYFDDLGSLGAIYTSATHDNKLYLGTNQGLFYKELSADGVFKKINGLAGQVWNLTLIDNTLFCAHNLGVFEINGTKVNPIFTEVGAWKFLDVDKNTILVGTYNGLHVLKRKKNLWAHHHKLDGFDISSRFFEITSDTTALVSHGYKGVFSLKLDKELTQIQEATILPIEKGPSSLSKMSGNAYYFNGDGFYQYDSKENKFDFNARITTILKEDTFTACKMESINDNQLFLFGKEYIYKLEKNIFSEELEVSRYFIGELIRKDVLGFENITFLSESNYLIGSREGYLITNFSSNPKITNDIIISQVTTKNVLQQTKVLDIDGNNDIPYDFNTITVDFSLPEFQYGDKIKYRYMLEGYNKSWSKWDNLNQITFGNLRYGTYTLTIQARISDAATTTIQRDFSILKPWYATNVALFSSIGLFFFMAFSVNKAYERYYTKQQARLIKENNQKLELIELRNNEKLIQLENKSLEENVQSKNRELAIATMAIVKKNQFLKTILQDLENMEPNPLVTRVIRIIKRNSKKDDDWDFFREAFDNSDKDFLKNLKIKHPKLTHNDMRLCAYLRLNLTSKEIAPLFNISAKSVEIKRYRLRKRMNLSRDENLVDYIINL